MEHDFHNWLRNHTSIQGLEKSVLLGIGDDGAILPESSSHTVVTTDTIAEGTHFDTSIHSLEQIGRKAIAVNLSDIAAMGATPTHAVLTLLMPRHFSLDDAKQLYSGIIEIASNYNVPMIGYDQVQQLIQSDVIEVCPLAYMRGRTLNESFIILDEAQNTTTAQMKMFLTRMGNASKIVVSGDQTQIDLPPKTKSGLVDALQRLKKINGVGISHLTSKDIVRHRLVTDIVQAYDGKPNQSPSS